MVPDESITNRPVRVFIVDDQRLVREGIASLLGIQDGLEVVGSASNGQEVLNMAPQLQPDVVLMDIRMPVMDGVTATLHLRRLLPTCRVVMLTTFDDEIYIHDALKAGAVGYILKNIPSHDLAHAVLMAHRGIYQLDPAAVEKLLPAIGASLVSSETMGSTPSGSGNPSRPNRVSPPDHLTEREIEVLRAVAQGATNKEIAEMLVISEGTVKNHISNILNRLDLRDRTQAAIYASEHGLL